MKPLRHRCSTVRSAVDRNLSLIRATVDRQLYEQLGVEPRSLSTVTRMKYGNGDEFYAFNYLQTDGTIKKLPYGDRRPERKREINHINQIERLL